MSRLRLLALLLACLPFSIFCRADMPPMSDADMKLTAVPGHPGAPAAVLYREEIYDDLHRHSANIQERIKILTEEGKKYADVIIPYDKKNLPVASLSGRTIHADGKIIPFEGKPFDKVIYRGKNIRYHVKAFSLPDVQVGSIIEFKYALIYPDNELYAPRLVVQDELWQKQVHFRFFYYDRDVTTDHDQTARGVAYTGNVPKAMWPKEVILPNNDAYFELVAADVPPFVEEPYMPDSDQFKFNIHFYYRSSNKLEEYWNKQAKFWNQDVEKFVNKRNGIADALAKIVVPTDTPDQKAHKIYDFILSLDNEEYVRSRTEQEIKALHVKDAKNAGDVLSQKRGDPEDLTRLFIAMCREAGLTAYAMRITSRENNFFDQNYLEFHQLDDEIAILQIDGKEVFVDPGARYAAFGILDWRHTACRGYRQTGDKPALAETISPVYTDAVIQRIGRFSINPDYSIGGSMRVVFSGFVATTHRQSNANSDDEGRKKDLEDEIKSWLPTDSEVKLVGTPNWNEIEKPLTAEFKVTASLASNAGKRVLFPAQAFHYGQKPMFPHAERVNGVYLYFPSREIDSITFTLPAGMSLESAPQPEMVKLEYAIYKSEVKTDKQTVVAVRDLAMNAYVLEKERYSEIKGFYDKVKAGDEQQFILRGAANAVAATGN